MKIDIHSLKINEKKAGVATLISDKIDSRIKIILQDKSKG